MDFCFVGNQCLLNQSGLPTLHSRVSFWDTKRRTVGSDIWPVLALQITEVGGFPDILQSRKQTLLVCCQPFPVFSNVWSKPVFRHMKATRTCDSSYHSLLVSPSHQGSAPASCPLQTATRLNPVKFWMLLTCIFEKGLNREECKQERPLEARLSEAENPEISRKCEKVWRLLLFMMGWPQRSGLFD